MAKKKGTWLARLVSAAVGYPGVSESTPEFVKELQWWLEEAHHQVHKNLSFSGGYEQEDFQTFPFQHKPSVQSDITQRRMTFFLVLDDTAKPQLLQQQN